ncbi:hypothetical protein [Methylocystis echinoides]|jgi:hypothetical protein|uniref:hypothetical protein n=1 Tax=Methylocystis echinoides TaxID=29468 RepID=UPI00342A09FA
MMKLPATINRHIVGASALLAALAVLGYATTAATPRRVASLPEEGFAIAQQAPAPNASIWNMMDQPKQIPQNAYGSARGSEQSIGEKITSGIKAVLPSIGSKSAKTDAKNWSDEDWRIAEQAVAESRRGSKNANSSSANAHLDTVWQPPEEIAGRPANQSR